MSGKSGSGDFFESDENELPVAGSSPAGRATGQDAGANGTPASKSSAPVAAAGAEGGSGFASVQSAGSASAGFGSGETSSTASSGFGPSEPGYAGAAVESFSEAGSSSSGFGSPEGDARDGGQASANFRAKVGSFPDTSQAKAKASAVLSQYLQISLKLLSSPKVFFKDLELNGSFKEAAIYLAVSASGYGVLSAVLTQFKVHTIPSRIIFDYVSVVVLAGVAFVIAKGVGSKVGFEAIFKIFSYTSCLHILNAVPGLSLITPIYGVVLCYLGLKQYLELSTYKTILVIVMVTLMSAVLNLGRMFSGN